MGFVSELFREAEEANEEGQEAYEEGQEGRTVLEAIVRQAGIPLIRILGARERGVFCTLLTRAYVDRSPNTKDPIPRLVRRWLWDPETSLRREGSTEDITRASQQLNDTRLFRESWGSEQRQAGRQAGEAQNLTSLVQLVGDFLGSLEPRGSRTASFGWEA